MLQCALTGSKIRTSLPFFTTRPNSQIVIPAAKPRPTKLTTMKSTASSEVAGMQEDQLHAYNKSHHPLLEWTNNATKVVVSLAAFGTLIIRRDLVSSWCILGSVIAAINCKILKLIINQSRPDNSRKADPGMPSAHANSLAFLSTFLSFAASDASLALNTLLGAVLVAGVPALASYLAYLRVALGYHTLPQVIVGWACGFTSAAAWWWWGSLLTANGAMLANAQLVHGLTTAAAVIFVVQNVPRWWQELRSGAA